MKTKTIKILIIAAGGAALAFLVCAIGISFFSSSSQVEMVSSTALNYDVPSILPSAWFINH